MSTYSQLIYHITFSTKGRTRTLTKPNRGEMYKHITGLLKNKKCHLYAINGIEDHIHIVTHIPPVIAPADLIKDIKLASTDLIKTKNLFPNFIGWQEGYGIFSVTWRYRDPLIDYVKNQEEHHAKPEFDFIAEYKKLLEEFGVKYDEKYLP
jgi:putative transposase